MDKIYTVTLKPGALRDTLKKSGQVEFYNSSYCFRYASENRLRWLVIHTMGSNSIQSEALLLDFIVTSKLEGRKPRIVYGSVTSAEGDRFWLVKFPDENYVELVPTYLFATQYPYYAILLMSKENEYLAIG